MTEDDCSSLDKFKEEYKQLEKIYSLPSFESMNNDFEIEKLQEKETETLSREIRRAMMDRNVSYLRFVEMFLNPSSAPMFFLALVKNLDNADSKALNEIYLDLGKFELKSILLDNEYDEKKDAEFIKTFFKEWQIIKKRFADIMASMEKAWERKIEKKDKGYLG